MHTVGNGHSRYPVCDNLWVAKKYESVASGI